MKKATAIAAILGIMPFLCSFATFMDEQGWVNWSNHCLTECFDPSAEVKIKKWEISLTPDHFIRLQKTYQQGNREYYSFNISRLANLNYLPGPLTDTLQMQTHADDIIMQTFDNPKGDIDSMATMLNIPVKKIPAARIDSLKQALNYLKQKAL